MSSGQSRLATAATSPIAHICLDQDFTSHSGNCRRTTLPRPPLGTRRKGLRYGRSAGRRIPSTPSRTVRPIGRSVRAHRPTAESGTDTRSLHRPSRRSSRHRRHRGGSPSSGWRRKRHIGSRMAQRLRRWRLQSLSIAYSRAVCCRPWMRTFALRSSRRFTSWAPLASAR